MTALALIDVGPAIASALTTATGRDWYFGKVPAAAVAPFGRVSTVAGLPGSTLERFSSRLSQVVQLTAAGKTSEDAGWLLDKARAYFDGVALPLAVSASTQIVGVQGEGPPSAPNEEGTLVSMNEDMRFLIGAV
jgi:hypothetical protein